MAVFLRIVAGTLLIAHGLVHLLYVTPDADDPKYPFTLKTSWLVPESARRPVAYVLMILTIVGFVLVAFSVWGVPGIVDAWRVFLIVAPLCSLALLIAFFDVQLLFGIALDVVMIVIAVLQPSWTGDIWS